MSSSPVIDVHAHASETKALAAWSTREYEVSEYGELGGVRYGTLDGDLDDLESAMARDGIAHAIVVNCFSVDEWRNRSLTGPEQQVEFEGSLAEGLFAFNRWLVEAVANRSSITPFVAMDPWVATADAMGRHLEEMQIAGALGVKVHPVDQRFVPSDPRANRLFRRCAELELPVISHSGPAKGTVAFAEPAVFGALLTAVPHLRLVIAHLGGAAWTQASALAADFSSIAFDCSEIVAWLGAPNAPSAAELVALIRDIGVDRVMFGSDFPWYDPGPMADVVRHLPTLSEGERAAILGENAARFLELRVSGMPGHLHQEPEVDRRIRHKASR
jgi:predicted TIM-barrel fold metal-dependent hydrolase